MRCWIQATDFSRHHLKLVGDFSQTGLLRGLIEVGVVSGGVEGVYGTLKEPREQVFSPTWTACLSVNA